MKRCPWPKDDPQMIEYHDTEWGKPMTDDKRLFEHLILSGVQAGLSWRIVLHKRSRYREVFHDFDPQKMARIDSRSLKKLLKDPGLVRNKLKMAAAIHNAKCILEIQKEFGSLSNYFWSFTNHKTILNRFRTIKEIPAVSPLSDKISRDLKARGCKFVGSTIIYAVLQAVGIVNDHLIDCFRHKQ